MRPLWCPICRIAYEGHVASDPCPRCFTPPPADLPPLTPTHWRPALDNTLADTHPPSRALEEPGRVVIDDPGAPPLDPEVLRRFLAAQAAPTPRRRPPSPDPEEDAEAETIECPDCAEEIKERARVCRFCGADVTARGAKDRRLARKDSGRLVTRKLGTSSPRSHELAQVNSNVKILLWMLVILPAIAACIFVPLAMSAERTARERARSEVEREEARDEDRDARARRDADRERQEREIEEDARKR